MIGRRLLVRQDDKRFDCSDLGGRFMRGQESANSTDQEVVSGATAVAVSNGAGTISFGIPGGVQAPRHARSLTASHLRHLDGGIASDAELIVSELVTNSIRHAGVRPDQLVTVDLRLFAERLRITVTDPGSDIQPHLLVQSPDGLGGHGLRLVAQLSTEWGVGRDAVGATQVWCDLVLAPGRGRVL
jgi:anti-sigma regulatory factor (Ser/Thr protein kinase)